jgi:hypothetical protein
MTMGIVFLNIPQLLVFVDWSALARRRRQFLEIAADEPEGS